MSSNKVVILGVDALEYNLVIKWDMDVFKQKEFGKVEVPILEKDRGPSTPVVWASFISGKSPEETGVNRFKDWNYPFINLIDEVAKKIGISLGFRKRVGDWFQKVGFEKKPPAKEKYKKMGTIFSDIPNSKAISIPSYNEDEKIFEVRRKTIYALENKISKKELAEEIFNLDREKVDEVIKLIKNHKLVMVHLFSLDVIQHIYFNSPEIIKIYYNSMENLVKKLKKNLSEDTLILIISDHGQKRGIHTPYGFYSSNIHLGLNYPSITGFRKIIKDYTYIESKPALREVQYQAVDMEKEKVKGRIRKLKGSGKL